MKWGRKKSSPPSLITRVFPVSWMSKFKQKGGNPETGSGKKQLRGKLDFPTPASSGWREAIFYSVDDDEDDAYWRLSFREGGEGRRRKGGINPLWFESDDEFQVPESSKGMKFSRLHKSISDVVLDIEKKMKEKQDGEKIKVRTESGSISRRSHGRKVKQADCRIRVLEDKKRGRKKLKKERKEQSVEFSSFAVVKSSFDPQLDFKESMVEMIRFTGIRRPEELEELLAAYLTLNPDKYHALIIKAFQQVWLHLRDAVYSS